MPRSEHRMTRADILPMEVYGRERAERRRAMTALKKNRRVSVGPDATFYFESYDTMWQQVHEMLYIEKGGESQIADELSAYNSLIPQKNEIVATVMFEIDNAARRAQVLAALGGVEKHMSLRVGGETVAGVPETDLDYTSEEGKASSVQFVHFALSPEQATRFCQAGTEIIVAITHPDYSHMAVMPENVRQALAGDL